MTDMKMTDKMSGAENDRHGNIRTKAPRQKMTDTEYDGQKSQG